MNKINHLVKKHSYLILVGVEFLFKSFKKNFRTFMYFNVVFYLLLSSLLLKII